MFSSFYSSKSDRGYLAIQNTSSATAPITVDQKPAGEIEMVAVDSWSYCAKKRAAEARIELMDQRVERPTQVAAEKSAKKEQKAKAELERRAQKEQTIRHKLKQSLCTAIGQFPSNSANYRKLAALLDEDVADSLVTIRWGSEQYSFNLFQLWCEYMKRFPKQSLGYYQVAMTWPEGQASIAVHNKTLNKVDILVAALNKHLNETELKSVYIALGELLPEGRNIRLGNGSTMNKAKLATLATVLENSLRDPSRQRSSHIMWTSPSLTGL